MRSVKAYAAQSPTSGVQPFTVERREPGPDDVAIDIQYCGICHTDIHFAENDWGVTRYPVVPGHEIVGRVTAVGAQVEAFAVGDSVGVGCMVDSCRSCSACTRGLEPYCDGMVPTYNGVDPKDGRPTFGGYSQHIVVPQRFVVRIPEKMDLAAAAPMLCAGITTYSPLRHVQLQPGQRVGVVGMGGLGHLGIRFARAMGAEVTVFTRSQDKAAEAERNGAHRVVISTDLGAMAGAATSLDVVLDTVPVSHDFNPYLQCLDLDGIYIVVGQLTPIDEPLGSGLLIRKRRRILGSLIGGMPETQEVLDFAAEHGVTCDIEMLKMDEINTAYARMKRGDVRYRFVLDVASLT